MLLFIYKKNKKAVFFLSDEKKRVMVTLSSEIAKDFDEIAKKMGLSKSALITLWINENRKGLEQKK